MATNISYLLCRLLSHLKYNPGAEKIGTLLATAGNTVLQLLSGKHLRSANTSIQYRCSAHSNPLWWLPTGVTAHDVVYVSNSACQSGKINVAKVIIWVISFELLETNHYLCSRGENITVTNLCSVYPLWHSEAAVYLKAHHHNKYYLGDFLLGRTARHLRAI